MLISAIIPAVGYVSHVPYVLLTHETNLKLRFVARSGQTAER